MNKGVFTYCIDKRDIIISVSPNWASFARANGWASEFGSENVVGHLLWDFIQDIETRHLYKELFGKVRTGKPVGPVPFRCDSPQERRFLEIFLSPLPDGRIEITSSVVRTERRDPVKVIDKDMPRSNQLIRICSMCKKIATPRNIWIELEEGVAQLKIFEGDEMPKLTHGVCPDCFGIAMAELDDFESSNKAMDSHKK
jgi:hypothetical protein